MAAPKRTYTLHINVYPDQKQWLTKAAALYDQSESEIVRIALGLLEEIDREDSPSGNTRIVNALNSLRRGMPGPTRRDGRQLPSTAG